MAGQKTRVSFVSQAESLFEMRDELFGQRLSPGAVVDRVGEFVMAGWERAVQVNVNHLDALILTHLSDELALLSPSSGVVSAETVDVIDAGVAPLRVFVVTRWQYDSGAHRDCAPPEFAEHWTLKFDELDVLGVCGFEPRRS